MGTVVRLLKSPDHGSEPNVLSALGHVYRILDDIVCKSIKSARSQDAGGERASRNNTGSCTGHIQQMVSLAFRFDEKWGQYGMQNYADRG